MSISIGGASPARGAGGFDPAKMATAIASRMMNELDTDKSGTIGKSEFVAGLKTRGISAADAGKQFDAIDTAGSGQIGKADIETALKAGKLAPPRGGPPPGDPAGPARAASAPAIAAKISDPADANLDGKVSGQEALIYSISQQAKPYALKAANSTSATFEKMA